MMQILLHHPEIRRFVLFLGVGSVNFAFYYAVFASLHLLGVTPTASVVIATTVGVLFNFCTTGRVVFRSRDVRVLPRFIGIYVVQCALNVLFLKALIAAHIPVLIAEFIVVGVLAVFTFLALRRWVFSHAAPP
jgi:putative flippase GtrA